MKLTGYSPSETSSRFTASVPTCAFQSFFGLRGPHSKRPFRLRCHTWGLAMVSKPITCNSPERLREKQTQVCQRSMKSREIDNIYYRIRVGTFNVNGKLPTQDLSTWLGNEPPSSRVNHPPLRELLPLSLSDKETGEASCLHGFCIMTHFSAFAELEGHASTPRPEPDMLVMAFQEIDHSTEAFFNFVGHAREESWTAAVLAGLGDKAERYEKVNFPMVTFGPCS